MKRTKSNVVNPKVRIILTSIGAVIGVVLYVIVVYGGDPSNQEENYKYQRGGGYKLQKLLSSLPHAIVIVSSISIVVTIILLMICSYKLANATELGQRKKAQCGNEYLEMETARYEVYEVYKKNVADLLEVAIILLMCAAFVPFVLIVGYQISRAFGANVKLMDNKLRALLLLSLLSGSLTMIGLYSKYVFDYMNPDTVRKYMKKAKINVVMPQATYVPVIFTCMLVLCGLTLYFMIYYGNETTILEGTYGLQYVVMSTLIIMVCGLALFWILKDYNNLKFNVGKTYYDTIDDLQSAAENLKHEKEFRRYLQINIKRAHPKLEGDPDIDSQDFKDRLYAYLEHRPGTDNYDNKAGFITVKMLKEVFEPFIKSSNTVMKKHDLLRALQAIYMRDGPVNDYVFTFKAIEDGISATSMAINERTRLSVIFVDAKRANPDLKGFVKATIIQKVHAFVEERETSLTDTEKDILENIMLYIAHSSEYKNDQYIPYETVLQNLDSTNLGDADVLGNIKLQITELEKNPQSTTKGKSLQKAMREARLVEPKVIQATNTFTNHVTWLSAIAIGVVLYFVMHYFYQSKRELTILLSSGSILFGIFAITWYSWFYSKLQL